MTQSFLTLLDIAQSHWTLIDQRNSSNIANTAIRNKRQNLSKTEQSVKTNLEGALNLLKWKNAKLIKVAYISEDHTRKFADFSELPTQTSARIRDRQQICFCAVIQI